MKEYPQSPLLNLEEIPSSDSNYEYEQLEDAKNQAHNEYLRILNSARTIEVRAEKSQML